MKKLFTFLTFLIINYSFLINISPAQAPNLSTGKVTESASGISVPDNSPSKNLGAQQGTTLENGDRNPSPQSMDIYPPLDSKAAIEAKNRAEKELLFPSAGSEIIKMHASTLLSFDAEKREQIIKNRASYKFEMYSIPVLEFNMFPPSEQKFAKSHPDLFEIK